MRRLRLLLGCLIGLLLAAAAWGWFGVLPADHWSVWMSGEEVGNGLSLSAATEVITSRLEGPANQVVTLTAAGSSWQFTRRALGLPGAPPDLSARLQAAAVGLPWYHRWLGLMPRLAIDLDVQPNSAQLSAALAPVRAVLERPAQPASLSVEAGAPLIAPEVLGHEVDQVALARALWAPTAARSALPDRIEIPVRTIVPSPTAADLQPLIASGPLATWSTYYDPAIPRAENVERAAAALSGLLLQPGQILSYNGQVGPVSAETGYHEAPVFADGQVVTGVGGGLCQVATTLYGAALRAGMTILERHPHQLAVSYIPLGEDAAVAPGFQDLKMLNSGPGPLFLTAQAGGGRVTFQIWGAPEPGITFQVESHLTGRIPYPTVTKTEPSIAAGAERVLTPGRTGFTAEAYRLVFHDGALLRREFLSFDRYEPVTAVILIGPVLPQKTSPH
jgi:vancomycin resistance protein YoaR